MVDTSIFVEVSTDPEQRLRVIFSGVQRSRLPRLDRQVRVKVDVSCNGGACNGISAAKDAEANEWCEVLLAQHVPQGAYIDVDEVKVRTIARSLPVLAALSGLALRLTFAVVAKTRVDFTHLGHLAPRMCRPASAQ